MHLVLQLLHLQANLKITCQTDVTLTFVRTIATIQEMTILETVHLQASLINLFISQLRRLSRSYQQKKGATLNY